MARRFSGGRRACLGPHVWQESANVAESPDDRSPMAIAFEWSATIMTISAEMVVPGLLGYLARSVAGHASVVPAVGLRGRRNHGDAGLIEDRQEALGIQRQARVAMSGSRNTTVSGYARGSWLRRAGWESSAVVTTAAWLLMAPIAFARSSAAGTIASRYCVALRLLVRRSARIVD